MTTLRAAGETAEPRTIVSRMIAAMSNAATYRQLEIWQRAMDLVVECYRLTSAWPAAERYGLAGQIRRAAVSIPSNVAEGACRKNDKIFMNHVAIALGSHAEIETCTELAARLGYLRGDQLEPFKNSVAMVGRLLNGLFNFLERNVSAKR